MGKTPFLRSLAFLFLLLNIYSAKATHIVGGVLNYRYTGSNNYEFTLFVYRDCKNGVALFDDPAMIQVSLGDNTEYNEYQAFITTPSDTLSAHVDDPCVTVQPDVCVEFVKYVFTINLPPNPLGYIVSYSRCCRNNSILNLTRGTSGDGLNEIDWGATYTINIPAGNTALQNSTPVFKNFPPVGICANKPIIFDHSATDANGDSLVYHLCAPFDGATKTNPTNNSPFFIYQQPPYTNVVFRSPYSLGNVMGGTPLAIDPHTGLLTGTPTVIGQFVVGVCVDEYRNGVFLTRTLRDFQYNVTDCGLKVVSSFFAPSIVCNNLTVGFTNQSSGATSYKWYFGDGDSSSAQNPSHTYADTGHYKVILISNPGQSCFATSSQIVSIQHKTVNADFSISDTICLATGDTIKFKDLSTDLFNINQWHWTFSTGKTDTLKNSFIIYNGTTTSITATLTVNSSNGCNSTITKTFTLIKKPPYTRGAVSSVCKGGKIILPFTMTGSNNIFTWTPSVGLDNPTIMSPTATVNSNIKYYVTIKSVYGTDTCIQKDSIQLLVNDSIAVHITPKNPTLSCSGRSVLLTAATVPSGGTVQWSTTPLFTTIFSTLNAVTVTIPGTSQTFYVRSTTVNGCAGIDSSKVTVGDSIPPISLPDTLNVCKDSVRLSVSVPAGGIVTWSTSPTFIPVIGSLPNLTIAQTLPRVKYFVKIQTGTCQNTDSVVVLFNDTIPKITLADNLLQCSNAVTVTAAIDHSDAVVWSTSPVFTPVLANGNTFTINQVPKTVKYYIKASYKNCFSTDSITVTIQDTIPTINLADLLNVCKDSVRLNAAVTNYTSIVWSTSQTLIPVIGTTPQITIAQSSVSQVYYIKANYRDCEKRDSIKVNYNDTLPVIRLNDSAFFCGNLVSALAVVQNADSVNWSLHPNFIPVFSNQPGFTTTQANALQTYYLKAFYRFCSTTDSTKIRVQNILPQIAISDSVYVCADSVRLVGRITNFDSVKWSFDPQFNTVFSNSPNIVINQTDPEKVYYVKVYYLQCEITDSFHVFKNDTIPTITIDRLKTIFCNDSVSATGTADFYTGLTWATDRDFTHVIATGSTFTTVQTEAEKWYYFKANYKFCFATDSIKLENRSIKYSAQDAAVCVGNKVSMDLGVQTPSQYDVIWYVNGDSIMTNNISTLEVTPDSTQTVRFHIDNIYGCKADDSLVITVFPVPSVDATADKIEIYRGEQVQLNATQGTGYTYNWTPANILSDPAIYNPTSSPLQTTLYTVVVSDRSLCTNTDTVTVRVMDYTCSFGLIFIPNAFTPNGDGINDVFRVRANILKSIHLVVYDRWGNQLFETDNMSDGWDGMYKGQPAPAESYGYYFTGECLQGEKITLKGNVTLMR